MRIKNTELIIDSLISLVKNVLRSSLPPKKTGVKKEREKNMFYSYASYYITHLMFPTVEKKTCLQWPLRLLFEKASHLCSPE